MAANAKKLEKLQQSMGKSGSFFFFSYDNRFVLKTLKTDEIDVLDNLVDDFYKHVSKVNPNSLLSRIYGFYEI